MRKEFPDQTKWVVYFQAPADIRNTGFLVWDLKNEQDRRWVYVPSIGQVRRLSVGDERKSFFGTDFVYEDMTNRDAAADTHTVVGSEKIKEWDCVIVESTPKNRNLAEFAKMRRWIWKKEALMMKMELYNEAGKVFKVGRIESLDQTQGIVNWHTSIMKNLETGSETKMLLEAFKYNTELDDRAFTEQQLSRGAP